MKHISLVLLCGLCILLMGCPLKTKTPISGKGAHIPSWLKGKWVGIKSDGSRGATYTVKKKALKRGWVDVTTTNDPDNKIPAFITKVSDKLFISIYQKGDGRSIQPGYYHYLLKDSNRIDLYLIPLKDHSVEFNAGGEAIRAFIETNATINGYLDSRPIEHLRRL